MSYADGKQPDEPVGVASGLADCPLATFLNETQPRVPEMRGWEIDGFRAVLFTSQGLELESVPLSPWQQYIVGSVDQGNGPITAAQFRRILRGACEFTE